MVTLLALTLALGQVEGPPLEIEIEPHEAPSEPAPDAVQCELRPASGPKLTATLSALPPSPPSTERRLGLTVAAAGGKRVRRLFESDRPELSMACAEDAVVVTWTRKRRGETRRATLRLVPKDGTLAAEPGLSGRIERGWKGTEGEDLGALAALLLQLPPVTLKMSPSLLPAVSIAAAKQAIADDEWSLAEELLAGIDPRDPVFRLRAPWTQRLRTVRAELSSARAAAQPLLAGPGKPIPLGSKQLSPTPPPHPMADVFWRSATEVCVPQEDRIPATQMRCYDAGARRWGAREPLRRPKGEVAHVGGGTCGYQDLCWHGALPRGEDVCAGVACDALLAVLPGPALVMAGPEGLVALRSLGEPAEPLPEGVEGEALARLPGSALAGGTLYFDGPRLIDARTGRSWRPFERALPKAQGALVSPDAKWALVWTIGTARAPAPLFLVPLRAR